MDVRKQLVGLLDYTAQMAAIGERAVFRLADYRGFVIHEEELRNRIGIHHDFVEGEERAWLRIDRLVRRDPPPIPDAIKPWLVVARDPVKESKVQPARMVTVSRREAEALVESGRAQADDVRPAMRTREGIAQAELRDVVLRLEHDPYAQSAIQAYLEGPWLVWAEEEKPRRETIRIYERLFSLQQAIESGGVERPLELVWGVGLARWKHPKQAIDHPLIEQLVEVEIDIEDGAIRIRPRSAEPMVAIKPYQELELPGADKIVRTAREHFKRADPDHEFSPFIKTSFEPVLRWAASQLDPEGRYLPDERHDLDDRSLPTASSTLIVTNSWVIYGRRRSANIVVDDIERLKAAVEQCPLEALPGTSRRLVSEPDDRRPTSAMGLPLQLGTGLAQRFSEPSSVAGQDHAFYFPKPFNDEQIEIVQRLEREDGIVVQGPPGTGKTHTIANIICHYMATGRRVLVISHGEAALGVLRDQIPAEVRELAISLLTNERQGLKQLERAVELLADDVSHANPRRLAQTIDDGEQRILQLKAAIANIDAELQALAAEHLERLGSASGPLPMELARRVVEAKAQCGWFPDRPESHQAPEFDNDDIARLRQARKILGADLAYTGTALPSPHDLPGAAVVGAIHENLVNAGKLAARSRAGDLPPLSLTADNALARAEAMLATLDGMLAAATARAAEPWLEKIFALARRREDCAEKEAFERVQDLLQRAAEGLRTFLATSVRAADDLFSGHEILNGVREALERQVSGRAAFALLSLGQGRVKALHATIRIDDRPVMSVNEARLALDYLAWRETLAQLRRRWNQLAVALDLPELTEDGERVGRWASEMRAKIAAQCVAAREHLPTALAELPDLVPFGISLDGLVDDEIGLRRVRQAIELNLTRRRLESSKVKLQDARQRLAGLAGEIAAEMCSFLGDVVGAAAAPGQEIAGRWQALIDELERIRALSSEFETIETITAKIAASGAPVWAKRLKSEPVEGVDDRLTPGNWREAWSWAQQGRFLRTLGGRTRLSQLAQARLAASNELERVFRQVVRDRTFLLLNHGMTDHVRSALVMFAAAICHIGAGTGIRARRFRRDARDAMDRCYAAVPCWIMPTWRVSESLPSLPGSFDLVIIDEASQSDVLALPAILRGNKVLIVGDDKQVSPVAVGVEEQKILQLRHNYLDHQPFAAMLLPGRSLYDLMGAVFPGQRIMLKEHFRCVEPIIRFSAREFYDNQIRPLRIPKTSERLDPPLIDILVTNGRKEGKVNLAEAKVIVEEIEKIVADPTFAERSIGVVSLIGADQAHKIQTLLLERIGEQQFMRHQIACGDSATFQGKERDIMFISMVEAPNSHSTKTGLMFQQRYNVALSRARDRMYLIRSLDENMLKPDDLKAKVIRHFRSPLEGANAGNRDAVALCESAFEREVYTKLVERGWCVRPQIQAGDYRIDLVIEGVEDRRLAVELDGDQYHGPDRWAEDYRRQLALERMGWRFWRCWGSSWTLDPEGCLADLEATLRGLGIEPIGNDTRPAIHTEHRIISGTDEAKVEVEQAETPADHNQQKLGFDVATEQAHDPLDAPISKPAVVNEAEDLVDGERVVEVGDRVVLIYNDDPSHQKTVVLTSEQDDDPGMGVIFFGRPLGKALMGQAEDDVIGLPAGDGVREATILRIEKAAFAA